MSAHLHLEANRFNPKPNTDDTYTTKLAYPELLRSNQVEARNTKRYPEVQKILLYNYYLHNHLPNQTEYLFRNQIEDIVSI